MFMRGIVLLFIVFCAGCISLFAQEGSHLSVALKADQS